MPLKFRVEDENTEGAFESVPGFTTLSGGEAAEATFIPAQRLFLALFIWRLGAACGGGGGGGLRVLRVQGEFLNPVMSLHSPFSLLTFPNVVLLPF